jgi:hypothetical protein
VIHFLFEKRENSLLRKDHEIMEFLLAHLIDWIIEKDENGENKDISINTSIVRPPAVYNSLSITPEEVLHDKDLYEKVEKLLAFVVGSGRRHASKYQSILEMELLSEIHVTSEYGPLLGVPNEQVPSLRHQTFKLAKDTTKKKFPELSDTIENLDRGVSHKIKKSTKKEIEKFNQLKSEDEFKKHGPIREWKPETGWKTIPYEEALKKRVKVPRRRRKKKDLARPNTTTLG